VWLPTRSHLKPKTIEGYESLLRVHVLPRFGTYRLDRIDTISIEQWIADLQKAGLSPSRIRQAYQVLHAMLKAAVKNRYIPRNPADGVKLPRQHKREMLFLDAAQVDRLASVVPDRYPTLIYLLAYTGMRWGEAAALRLRRIDVLRARIEIAESLEEVGGSVSFGTTKNHKRRTIVIPSFLRDLLNDHVLRFHVGDQASLIFTASNGAPMRNSNFSSYVWRPAVVAADLPANLRIHDLRHTAAALLISQGGHPEAIKRQLGHSSIRVSLDTYGHLFPSEAEALAASMDNVFRRSQTDNRRTMELSRPASVQP
jgi:integrase